VNPNINSRFGILCPTCQKKLINPNKPWPVPCATCGTRTHVGCLTFGITWLVDLDTSISPNQKDQICGRCLAHASNNLDLINRIPAASGSQPQDTYRRYVAQMPKLPKRHVTQLWGDYRVDPDNFVPAVTKVLDIVHNTGPKVRWAVKLGGWQQVPMTNLSSKEILLPNYFESPNALGRTHQEVLDAMTGAAMHEAGHAAYDTANTMLEAQRRIKPGPGQYTWASATCLNIVCDYNLERKVIERYPAFRHYFEECHRWSVRDSLPNIINSMQQQDAEDRMDVRLAILVWELLGPGDIEAAGGTITPKLQFITRKCFDVLKYAFTRGLLNSEPGKLKTAKALYELIRVVTPVGYMPPVQIQLPQQPGQQPPNGPQIGGFPSQQGQSPQPSQGDPQDSDDSNAEPSTPDDGHGSPTRSGSDSSEVQDSDESAESGTASGKPDGTDAEPSESESSSPERDAQAQSDQEPGDQDTDGNGSGTDPGDDGDDDADSDTDGDSDIDDDSTTGTAGDSNGSDSDDEEDSQAQGEDGQGSQNNNDGNSVNDPAGEPDNTGPESEDVGGSPGVASTRGGKSGSETESNPANDPWTGAGDLQDDPSRRKNSRKDALDDLSEENANEPTLDPYQERNTAPLVADETFDRTHREESARISNPPEPALFPTPPDYQMPVLETSHASRLRELSPVISRLKKVLRFRNADWGGQQTGRRAGTLTRRHVSRLSAFGSDKVFHKTMPDQTPKVRIALIIDESESMNGNTAAAPYIAAKNAATALTQALHGIRGVKLWSWGFSLNRVFNTTPGYRQVPTLRAYVDPLKPINPASIEVSPMNGGTPTGEAMDYAATVITRNSAPNEKKIVFIITDGEAGGFVSTASAVRKWTGKVTFVHIGIGNTVDKQIPFYIGPVTDVTLLPDLLSESVSEILR
jgi:von Willebrand factor type A domain